MRAPILTLLACAACEAPTGAVTKGALELDELVVDPQVLYREGQRARDRGDEVRAGRLFDRARTIAERTHGKLAVATGRRMTVQEWSADGRWVVFRRADGATTAGQPPGLQIVDAKTGSSFVIDGDPRVVFARDGRTLVIQDPGLRAIDLETRAVRMPQREVLPAEARIAPDGRLAWIESGEGEQRVVLRDLATDRETVLRTPDSERDLENIGFGSRGEVIAWTEGHYAGEYPGLVRVWRHDEPTPVAVADDLAAHAPIVEDGLLVYGARVGEDTAHLQFLELDLPGAKIQKLPASGACGRGDVGYHLERCAPRVFAVDSSRLRACMWDLQRRRVVQSLPLDGQDIRCSTTKLELIFEGPPDDPDGEGPTGPLTTDDDGAIRAGKIQTLLVDSAGTTNELENEPLTHVAGIAPGHHGRMWSFETGKLVWQATKASRATGVAFAPTGRKLAIVAANGTGWHVDLATGTLTSSPAPGDCTMQHGDNNFPIAVDPYGRMIRYCGVSRPTGPSAMEVWIEGERRPLSATQSYASHPMLVTSESGGLAAIVDKNRLHAVTLPDGEPRLAKTILPDLGAYMAVGVTAAADRVAVVTQTNLELYDARGKQLWKQQALPDPGTQLVFSRDGELLGVPRRYAGTSILATDTGKEVDTVKPLGRAFAFDPRSRRVAFWLGTQLVVKHVGKAIEQRHEWGVQPMPLVPSIAWSPDGQLLAAVVGDSIVIWRVGWKAPLATIQIAGRGAVAIRGDGRLHLLGDPPAARALVACRFGDELYPFAVCEDRLVRSDSLATAFAP
ncbi:MAG TPA: hypothetical protein VIU61_26505 [Kofleriaceae bacterium]